MLGSVEEVKTGESKQSINMFEELLGLCMFAESYEFRLMKLLCIRTWQSLERNDVHCFSKVVARAYATLSSESKLIGLIAQNHALWERKNSTHAQATEKGMPGVFFRDVLNWERAIRAKPDRFRSAPCKFHDHVSKAEQEK